MITCIYDYISNNKCIKCMISMHEIACYHLSSNMYEKTYLPSFLEGVLEAIQVSSYSRWNVWALKGVFDWISSLERVS